MRSCSFPIDKLIVARFDAGDDILLSIKQVVVDHSVTAGMFNLIGAVDRAHYGFYDPEEKLYKTQSWTPSGSELKALEILACVGNIAVLASEPIIHGHITFQGYKEQPIGGHLLEGCRVCPTGELTLLKASGVLVRQKDNALNLALLSI